MRSLCNLVICVAALLPLGEVLAEEGHEADTDKTLLRAAIFVQNRAGIEFQDKLDTLNDMITTRLTQKGFSIIDKNDVLAKFRESRESNDEVSKTIKTLTDLIESGKAKTTVENIINSSSALRIAQLIQADYLIFVTINSAGQEKRKFKGQGTLVGTDTEITIHTLRIALKVLEGNQGGSVYGDIVTVSEKVATLQNLETQSTDLVNKLLDAGAIQIAENIADKVQSIRTVKVKSVPTVEFTIEANVEAATVELDGLVIGSTPLSRYKAPPGSHHIRVTKEYFTPWERWVNIYQGQVLRVTLELSEEGARRYKDIETYKQMMAQQKQDMELQKLREEAEISIAKEQSAAEAEAKRLIAEGEKKKREQSYIHDDGIGNELKKIIHGEK